MSAMVSSVGVSIATSEEGAEGVVEVWKGLGVDGV